VSNVHVIHIEDANGDLVDIEYFHHGCAPEEAKEWPAPEAIDYPVYCKVCGQRVEAVPLTEDGVAYMREREVHWFPWDDDVIVEFTINAKGERVVSGDEAYKMVRSIIWHVEHPEAGLDLTPAQAVMDIALLLQNVDTTSPRPIEVESVVLPDYGIEECREDGRDIK